MRNLLTILLLMFSLSMSATSKDTLNAVTMVSYEQGCYDTDGTLALKNNTNEDIYNISYRIIYFDMKGNELDYKEGTSEIDIAPGMTKKVDITAYEHERNYSYYLSEAYYKPHKFKIKFELTAYNTPDEDKSQYGPSKGLKFEIPSENSQVREVPNPPRRSLFELSVLPLVTVGAYIGICVGMFLLVVVMAKRRKRNEALWLVISIFVSPILTIILLLCLGNSKPKVNKVKHEEIPIPPPCTIQYRR